MPIELPDDFAIFEVQGLDPFRVRRRLGQNQEHADLHRNAHWLRANVARGELLTHRRDGGEVETTSTSDVLIFELPFTVSAGRSAGATCGVTWEVDAEQAVVTVTALDDAGSTTLDSASASVTTRAQSSGLIAPAAASGLLRVELRAQPSQTGVLYGVRLREAPITDAADLRSGGFIGRVSERYAPGASYCQVDAGRLLDAIERVNEDQMMRGGFAWRADHAPRWAAVSRKSREWIRPVSPEAASLTLGLRYEVHGPGVEVRWAAGLRGTQRGAATAWESLTSTGARHTWSASLDLSPVHGAGLERYGLCLDLKSLVSDDPGDVHTYTVKGYSNIGEYIETTVDPTADFDALDGARLRFYDSGGDELGSETQWQAQLFGSDRIYVYPWIPDSINTRIVTIEATLAGSITVYGLHAAEVHGLPYGGVARRFPWQDKDEIRSSFSAGRPLASLPHAIVYNAQEHLAVTRGPVAWGGYAEPSASVVGLRDWAESKLNESTPGSGNFQTFARLQVGGDVTLERHRQGVDTRHQRRALEVFAVVIGESNRARAEGGDNAPCPLLFRLRRTRADGTVTAEGAQVRLDVQAADLENAAAYQIWRGGNLHGLLPPGDWGQVAYGLAMELTDTIATEGEVLELQVGAISGEEGSAHGEIDGERGFIVSLLSWYVRPPWRSQWASVVRDL